MVATAILSRRAHSGAHLVCPGRESGDMTHRSAQTFSSGTELDSELLRTLSGQTSSVALSSRPMSAAAGAQVRGSRPNSAAIAATIEGFENDFMVSRFKQQQKFCSVLDPY